MNNRILLIIQRSVHPKEEMNQIDTVLRSSAVPRRHNYGSYARPPVPVRMKYDVQCFCVAHFVHSIPVTFVPLNSGCTFWQWFSFVTFNLPHFRHVGTAISRANQGIQSLENWWFADPTVKLRRFRIRTVQGGRLTDPSIEATSKTTAHFRESTTRKRNEFAD